MDILFKVLVDKVVGATKHDLLNMLNIFALALELEPCA